MSPDVPMMIMTVVLVSAGLFSIVGSLMRTAKRPAPGAEPGRDGGPMFAGPSHGRHGDDGDGEGDGDGGGD